MGGSGSDVAPVLYEIKADYTFLHPELRRDGSLK